MGKPNLKRATEILRWMTVMCADDWRVDITGDDPPVPPATRIGWLRSPRSPLPFLAVDTPHVEAHQLWLAGLLEQGDDPTVLVVKKETTLRRHPSYRLTELGRRWCAVAYRDREPEDRHFVMDMLRGALAHPEDVAAIHDRLVNLRLVLQADKTQRLWVALVVLACGHAPQASADVIRVALDDRASIIAEAL